MGSAVQCSAVLCCALPLIIPARGVPPTCEDKQHKTASELADTYLLTMTYCVAHEQLKLYVTVSTHTLGIATVHSGPPGSHLIRCRLTC